MLLIFELAILEFFTERGYADILALHPTLDSFTDPVDDLLGHARVPSQVETLQRLRLGQERGDVLDT